LNNSNYTNNSSYTIFFVNGTAHATTAIPICSHCGAQTLDALVNDDDAKPCCKRCALIKGAPKWLEAAFIAVGDKAQRQKLYRALSQVFHPDVGGDERLMKALNAAKERFT
jgi:hypothetical protein